MKKYLLPAILVFHLILLFTLQFTAWPEMYSYPYLLNNGFSLYRDIIYPYPPLLVIILSRLYLYFGYSPWTLKIFTWSLLLINDLLVFVIAKKITKLNLKIYLSLFFYALAQSILEGNMLWFDISIVTPLLAALYLTLSFPKANKIFRKSYLMSIGFTLSLAAFTKQTSALFIIFYLIYFIYQKLSWREYLYFLFAPLFMGALFILKLASKKSLLEALNWMLFYPLKYWSHIPGYVEFNLNKNQIFILLLLLIPAFYAFYTIKEKRDKKTKFLLFGYLAISVVIIYPRFSFFHFQLGIALVAVLLSFLKPKFTAFIISIFFFAVFLPKYQVFSNQEIRFMGDTEKDLSLDIASRVSPDQTVYLLNLHSGHYSQAKRLPPKPWFDNFAWYLEIPGLQEKILSRWEQEPPDFIYFQTPQPGDWYELGTYLPKDILIWILQNYEFIDTYKTNIQIYKYRPSESEFPDFAKLNL